MDLSVNILFRAISHPPHWTEECSLIDERVRLRYDRAQFVVHLNVLYRSLLSPWCGCGGAGGYRFHRFDRGRRHQADGIVALSTPLSWPNPINKLSSVPSSPATTTSPTTALLLLLHNRNLLWTEPFHVASISSLIALILRCRPRRRLEPLPTLRMWRCIVLSTKSTTKATLLLILLTLSTAWHCTAHHHLHKGVRVRGVESLGHHLLHHWTVVLVHFLFVVREQCHSLSSGLGIPGIPGIGGIPGGMPPPPPGAPPPPNMAFMFASACF